MARRQIAWADRWAVNRLMRRFSQLARVVPTGDSDVLRQWRGIARDLRVRTESFSTRADERLARPALGSTTFFRPRGTDWSWRPDAWRGPLAQRGMTRVAPRTGLDEETSLFHDCRDAQLILTQPRNRSDRDLAPYGLRIEAFHFTGSFLSLAVDLPRAACTGLTTRHIIRVDARTEQERHGRLYARLNIQHGPNIEQLLHEIPQSGESQAVEFDLAYLDLNEKRIEKIWLDLMIEEPAMNRVTVRDLTFCRYPRAEL